MFFEVLILPQQPNQGCFRLFVFCITFFLYFLLLLLCWLILQMYIFSTNLSVIISLKLLLHPLFFSSFPVSDCKVTPQLSHNAVQPQDFSPFFCIIFSYPPRQPFSDGRSPCHSASWLFPVVPSRPRRPLPYPVRDILLFNVVLSCFQITSRWNLVQCAGAF